MRVTQQAAAQEAKGTLEVALAHARRLLVRDPAMAVEQAREILRAVPGHVETLLLLGEALAQAGREDEAIGVAVEATRRDPRSPQAWRLLGDLLYRAHVSSRPTGPIGATSRSQ